MKTHPLTSKHWFWVALAAVVLGVWFVTPYLGVIALAALMAFLFYGTYSRINERRRPGTAATLTFFFSLLVVLLPVIVVSLYTIFQLGQKHFNRLLQM
jgi:predicted PurR-regulated permease PerM